MTTKRKPVAREPEFEKPVIQTPETFDLEQGLAMTLELIRRNPEWVKEMAKK